MVEFGGNNPGKNESPEEFNHRTSVQISVLFHKNVRQTESWKKDGSHEEFNHRIVFKYSINVLHDACKVVDLFWKCVATTIPDKNRNSRCTFELVVLTSVAQWIEWANLNKVLKNIHTDYQNVVTETLKTSGGDAGKWTRSRCFWENKIVENTICKPTNNVCAWSPGTAETINVVALKYINILNILNTSRLQHM